MANSGAAVTSPIYKRATNLMEAELHEELVALDPERGICFGLNSVAAQVWRLLERPRTLPELCAALTADYDVGTETCRRDVQDLLANMIAEGLVAEASVGEADVDETGQGKRVQ